MFDAIELLRRAAGRPSMSTGIVLRMALLKLPHMAEELAPFVVLFASMITFWRLTRSHELTVARAAGVSVWQFLLPVIGFAALFGVFKIAVINPAGAVLYGHFERMEAQLIGGGSSLLAVSNTGFWLRQVDEKGNSVVYARRVSSQEMQLFDVIILNFEGQDRFVSRVDAASARLETGHWLVTDAWLTAPERPARFESSYRIPTAMTVEQIQDSFASPLTISFWELPGVIRMLEAAGLYGDPSPPALAPARRNSHPACRDGPDRSDVLAAAAPARRNRAPGHIRRLRRIRALFRLQPGRRARPERHDPGRPCRMDACRRLEHAGHRHAAASRGRIAAMSPDLHPPSVPPIYRAAMKMTVSLRGFALSAAVALLAVWPALSQEQRIVAVVNDDIVSNFDIDGRIALTLVSTGAPDTPDVRQRMRAQVLRQLIDERIQIQESKRLGLTIPKTEIDEAIKRIEQSNKLPPGGLDQILRGAGVPRSAMDRQIEATMAWQRLVHRPPPLADRGQPRRGR